MLDINFIHKNVDLICKNCEQRRVHVDIASLLKLDDQRRNLQQQIDGLRAERNSASKIKPSSDEIVHLRKVSEQIKQLKNDMLEIQDEYNNLLLSVPNMTHPDSPIGGEEDFTVLETRGTIPTFDFEPKDHEILMTDLDIIDFERGAKVTGTKFYYYKNDMVRLNQALLNYGFDILEKHAFTLLETPDMAKQNIIVGAGFNPRGEETNIYSIENTDLSLIGTAEITVLGYHKDEILDLSNGPKKYAAISHCFRTEAGSYGRTSKGLYRVHQFTKLEMFIFCTPEESETAHKKLLAIEKEICDGLGLAYQVIDVATADLGAPTYRKFDIEAYMTMKNGYGEITSTSNCTDYQARQMNIKYKKNDGTTEFVNTLNGTAIVLSRFPIAIMEQFQQEDGSVLIPKVLQKYFLKERIEKR